MDRDPDLVDKNFLFNTKLVSTVYATLWIMTKLSRLLSTQSTLAYVPIIYPFLLRLAVCTLNREFWVLYRS